MYQMHFCLDPGDSESLSSSLRFSFKLHISHSCISRTGQPIQASISWNPQHVSFLSCIAPISWVKANSYCLYLTPYIFTLSDAPSAWITPDSSNPIVTALYSIDNSFSNLPRSHGHRSACPSNYSPIMLPRYSKYIWCISISNIPCFSEESFICLYDGASLPHSQLLSHYHLELQEPKYCETLIAIFVPLLPQSLCSFSMCNGCCWNSHVHARQCSDIPQWT